MPTVRRQVAFVAALSLALSLSGAAVAHSAAPRSVVSTDAVGASGVGDPYFPLDGNGGYDVRHYDIADRYDIASGALRGATTVTAVATEALSRFDLDLVLSADRVTVNGRSADFHAGAHELVVTPTHALAAGDTFRVVVSYHGHPDDVRFHNEGPWNATPDEVTAANEPHIAPWWFAANDHPTDKATYDITISVPRGKQVISNGTLVSHESAGVQTTWHWSMDTPIASYLAFFAAGSFAMRSGVEHGLPFSIAASRRLSDVKGALAQLGETSDIVAWLETQFGPYPFSSTGGLMTVSGQSFSLENATRPTYPEDVSMSTVVHELAHQWFGDDVSVHRWSDIWLNEGFASFATWLYQETHGGQDAQERLVEVYDSIPSSDPFWSLKIGDPGPDRLFDSAVYVRGEMTLQALRHRIGDTAFFRVLKQWVAEHGGATGSIPQFERLASSVSGADLDGFFKVWLFTESKPAKTKANGLV